MAIVKRKRHRTNRDERAKTKGYKKASGKSSTSGRKTREGRRNGGASTDGKRTGGGRRTGGVGGMGDPSLAVGDPERGETGKPRRTGGARGTGDQRQPQEIRGGETGEPAPAVALSSSWSDCWRALALAVACFRHCFSFFNCLFFS